MLQLRRIGCENFSVGSGRILAVIILLLISSLSIVFVKKECIVLNHITTNMAPDWRCNALGVMLNEASGKMNDFSLGVDTLSASNCET
jgi:hypothetical protein